MRGGRGRERAPWTHRGSGRETERETERERAKERARESERERERASERERERKRERVGDVLPIVRMTDLRHGSLIFFLGHRTSNFLG